MTTQRSRRLWRNHPIRLLLLALPLLGACAAPPPAPVALDAGVCDLEPALCEKWCAGCPDKKSCIASGGECVAAGLRFNDTGDQGADIWTPGCHQEYTDAQCTVGQTFFLGDVCGQADPDHLIEWTRSTCHGAIGDRQTYDCDAECRRAQRGGGTCASSANACGAGMASAYCKCDLPPPSP